jgi:hypothetical protein
MVLRKASDTNTTTGGDTNTTTVDDTPSTTTAAVMQQRLAQLDDIATHLDNAYMYSSTIQHTCCNVYSSTACVATRVLEYTYVYMYMYVCIAIYTRMHVLSLCIEYTCTYSYMYTCTRVWPILHVMSM